MNRMAEEYFICVLANLGSWLDFGNIKPNMENEFQSHKDEKGIIMEKIGISQTTQVFIRIWMRSLLKHCIGRQAAQFF